MAERQWQTHTIGFLPVAAAQPDALAQRDLGANAAVHAHAAQLQRGAMLDACVAALARRAAAVCVRPDLASRPLLLRAELRSVRCV